jgi:hypothetical protein
MVSSWQIIVAVMPGDGGPSFQAAKMLTQWQQQKIRRLK